MSEPMPGAQEFWDGFYGRHTRAEQGPVNRELIAQVRGLPPGRALDLGSSEGADAIWLAQQGWSVLAAEVSATACARARTHAARLGLDDRLIVQRRDLATDFPAGEFDLVCALFLHSPVDPGDERARVLRRAVRAVGPGGHLLVVSHWTAPDWHPGMPPVNHPVNLTVPAPDETRATLALPPAQWRIVRDEVVATQAAGPQGQPGVRQDHVLHAQRAS